MKNTMFLTLAMILVSAVAFAADLPLPDSASSYYKSYKHEQQKQYEEAIRDLTAVCNTYSGAYTANYRVGWLYYLNKDYSNAMKHLRKALAMSPKSVEVMNTITLVHAARADWSWVEEQAMATLRIDSYNAIANYWLSHSLRMQGKLDLAVNVDRKMLEAFPTSVTFLQELGENLYLQNKMEESGSIFHGLKILSPKNEKAAYYLKKLERAGQ